MCAVKAHLTFLYLPHILVEFPWQVFAGANYQLFSDFHRCTILENPQLSRASGRISLHFFATSSPTSRKIQLAIRKEREWKWPIRVHR